MVVHLTWAVVANRPKLRTQFISIVPFVHIRLIISHPNDGTKKLIYWLKRWILGPHFHITLHINEWSNGFRIIGHLMLLRTPFNSAWKIRTVETVNEIGTIHFSCFCEHKTTFSNLSINNSTCFRMFVACLGIGINTESKLSKLKTSTWA